MSEKNAKQRRDLAGQLWLSYYNRVLYEKGLITEQRAQQDDAENRRLENDHGLTDRGTAIVAAPPLLCFVFCDILRNRK